VTAQMENLTRHREQIIQCENCGRIFYIPDEASADEASADEASGNETPVTETPGNETLRDEPGLT